MKKVAYKVIAEEGNNVVAEYIFEYMKQALLFEMGMRKEGYITKLERIWV